ncbi:MAG: V-type ATPase subunit [Oscillospiraceae bacterium]|nr:V-type ATPase subunit [Oscillospiraceae bacterium]
MISGMVRYGAVSAKVRAMYGKRLSKAEFSQMSAMKSTVEVALFLREHPFWGKALEGASLSTLNRRRFEYLLKRHYLLAYLRLFRYLDRQENFLLRLPVIKAENEQIMRFMRFAMNGRAKEYVFDLPPHFSSYSRIRYDALSSAATYDDMLHAVRETEFYEALRAIRPITAGFPSYLEVESAMRRYCFRSLHRLASKKKGAIGVILRKSIEMQADWINISQIERMILHYPELRSNATFYLIPVLGGLSAELIGRLSAQEDPELFYKILQSETCYSKFLASHQDTGESMETLSRVYQIRFFRKYITQTSLLSPIAFFNLFNNELLNLIHVIECVRYGLPPEKANSYLVLE